MFLTNQNAEIVARIILLKETRRSKIIRQAAVSVDHLWHAVLLKIACVMRTMPIDKCIKDIL